MIIIIAMIPSNHLGVRLRLTPQIKFPRFRLIYTFFQTTTDIRFLRHRVPHQGYRFPCT